MKEYSALALVRNAFSNHKKWKRAWRDPEPKSTYDVVIIGAGGHGLATAYYLAKEHGITNVAVLEKGWLGGGNTGRNTTIIRSNYLLDENSHFYEFSLKLWEGLSQDLNFNVMFSQRGVLQLAHNQGQRDMLVRRGNAMRLNGVDGELLTRKQIKHFVPILDCSEHARFPVFAGLLQRRGGTARHDGVAWGYARAADRRGVDIIQNCEVKGLRINQGRIAGVETERGYIAAKKVGIVVAGHTSQVAAMADIRLPIESHLLQAMVSEPIKPVLDTVVMAGSEHAYVSQTDKGEILMGSDLDYYPSYSRRGGLPRIETIAAQTLALFPSFSRLRMMRSWAGIMDMTMDGSPIIANTSVDGLYINGGWNYGGFKATPASGWTFAYTLAQGQPHRLNQPYSLDRFERGYTIDEHGAGPVPHAH